MIAILLPLFGWVVAPLVLWLLVGWALTKGRTR